MPDPPFAVILITGLILCGLIIDLGGGPDHDRIGFRYWNNPGAFNQYRKIHVQAYSTVRVLN